MRFAVTVLFIIMFVSGSVPSVSSANSLESLLLSSPWCSFSYNKTSGYSHTKRVQFFSNGTYSMGKGGEGSSSGYGGSFASQHNSRISGQWGVHNGALYLTEGNGPPEMVVIRIKTNSNGYPVIVADGVEFTPCR